MVTTVAGNGVEGFSGDGSAVARAILKSPGGVAVDAAGNLYIADSSNNRIRKLNTVSKF
jgi:DNA-binding beta-propeller fold protein YncE